MQYAQASAPRPSRRQGGYALILMLALLISGSLYAFITSLSTSDLKNAQAAATPPALQKARDALLGYAVTYRESHPLEGFGHFPCPDTNGDGEAETYCSGTISLGLLPYKTLGLPDLRDDSGACLWYAVSASFKNNPKSDPLNWDAQGEITITNASGSTTLQAANDSRGGVAVAVIAPGAPLAGQANGKLDSGYPCRAMPSQAGLYLESIASPFRQGPGLDATGNPINDQLLWLSSADVFDRIRMRGDFPTYLNSGIKGIQSALSFSTLAPAADPNNGNSTTLLPLSPPSSLSQTDQRFYLQWRDQFVYRNCSTSNSYCYKPTAGTPECDGVLLFSGEKTSGNPLRSLPRPNSSRTWGEYFETAIALANGTSNTLPPSMAALYNSSITPIDQRSQDLVLCLSPKIQTLNSSPSSGAATPTAVTSTTTPIASYTTGQSLPYLGLGQLGTAATSYGCLWYPAPLQLGASSTPINLRAYFSFTINDVGQGFTFTLADADSSINPSSNMCGKGGAYLGYAGSNGETARIAYPKIGLEIDTNKDGSLGDADSGHLALIYWAAAASANDDNSHGVGSTTSPDSLNPGALSAGYRAYPMQAGTTYYVRLEMQRTYQADPSNSTLDTATHDLRAYITTSPCVQFSDLSAPLVSLAATPVCLPNAITDTLVLRRSADGPAPMKQVWIGFTTGQDALDQEIRIQNFKVQVAP